MQIFHFFRARSFFRSGACPNCSHDVYAKGPENGVEFNIRCEGCGQYFVVNPEDETIERIYPDNPW